MRDITQQTEYVIAFTHVTRVMLGEFELMLSIGDDSVVIGSFAEIQSLNCCVKSVDSGINIFGPSNRIIALVKIVDDFGVDLSGIARVKFCRVRNIEKQLSLFVLSEEWRI